MPGHEISLGIQILNALFNIEIYLFTVVVHYPGRSISC